MNMTYNRLNEEQLEAFGKELDAIRDQVLADLGERDAQYIRKIVKLQRRSELLGRGLLFAGIFPPAWLAGVSLLTLSKVLDAGEIGHNVMHGQYDWMNDPALNSKTYEWDFPSVRELWCRSHNYMHHVYTNIQGVDRDIGYGILRMSEEQKWHPYYLLNPVMAFWLAIFFQWGIALHEVEVEKVLDGTRDKKDLKKVFKVTSRKASRHTLKEFVLFPALAGPFALQVLSGNIAANITTNVFGFMVIFCGHFPDGVEQFPKSVLDNETRGQWYYRQLLGSANIKGGKLFHILTGNLSHQIEHHFYPALPAHRYAEISVQVQEICERYDLPYNTGSLSQQFGSVVKRICRLALPSSKALKPSSLGSRLSNMVLPAPRKPVNLSQAA